MVIREAREDDLPAIVAIYNSSIPAGVATADTDPVTVESRLAWFREHVPGRRPFRVADAGGTVVGWLSFQSFYGRPAYHRTAELSVYVTAGHQRRGIGRALVANAIASAPALDLSTLLAFVFGHNEASLGLFDSFGFDRWGRLPKVAELDGVERDLLVLGLRVSP